MNTVDVKARKLTGVQLAEKMLESQRQTAKEIREEYANLDSPLRKAIEKLKQKNAERGTPIASEI